MGLFWSYRTTKIPSSPSKPVPGGSKIVGKREREKREKVRIMTDLWSFSIASALATWTIIFMTASSPCEQKHTLGCPFAAMDSYSYFSLHHEIQFDLVERISTRSMPHRKRLAKVEAIPFPTSKHFQSTLNSILAPHKMTLILVQKKGIQHQSRAVSSQEATEEGG